MLKINIVIAMTEKSMDKIRKIRMYSVFWRNHLWDCSTWVLRHGDSHTLYVNHSPYFISLQDIPYHRMQGTLPGPVSFCRTKRYERQPKSMGPLCDLKILDLYTQWFSSVFIVHHKGSDSWGAELRFIFSGKAGPSSRNIGLEIKRPGWFVFF